MALARRGAAGLLLLLAGCSSPDFRLARHTFALRPGSPAGVDSISGHYAGELGECVIDGDSVRLRVNGIAIYRFGDPHGYGYDAYEATCWFGGSYLDTTLILYLAGRYDSTGFAPMPDSVGRASGAASVHVAGDTLVFNAVLNTAGGSWPQSTGASYGTLARQP